MESRCTLFCSVPTGLYAAFEQLATQRSQSVDDLVRAALDELVATLPPGERSLETYLAAAGMTLTATTVTVTAADSDTEPAETVVDHPDPEHRTLIVAIRDEVHEGLRVLGFQRRQSQKDLVIEALRDYLRREAPGAVPPEER